MVPHFKRLSDFILAKKWYMRAVYMPGPERDDLDSRMRRHRYKESIAAIAKPWGSTMQFTSAARQAYTQPGTSVMHKYTSIPEIDTGRSGT